MVVKVVFYGVLLNVEKFGENIFIFSTVMYVSEVIAESSSGYAAEVYGRKVVLVDSFLVCMIAFLLSNFFFSTPYISIILFFLGTFCISAAFNVIFIYTPELFETNVRASATSYSKLFGNFNSMFSQFIISKIAKPFLFFSALSGVAFICMKMCKETKEFNFDLDKLKSSKSVYYSSKNFISVELKEMLTETG